MNIREFNPEAGTNTVAFEHKDRLFRFEAYTTEALNEEVGILNEYCEKICEEITTAIDNGKNINEIHHDRVYGNIVEIKSGELKI